MLNIVNRNLGRRPGLLDTRGRNSPWDCRVTDSLEDAGPNY